MKKLFFLSILVFSILVFSSPSYAKWTEVAKARDGTTYYVDFEKIRKFGGYVYVWVLADSLIPSENGALSYKIYFTLDCRIRRDMPLSFIIHEEPMAGGRGRAVTPPQEWAYPSPGSPGEIVLEKVCGR